jgi:predicted MFS family arabinose efflux permease
MLSLGYTGRMAQFMTVPIYCVALVVALIMGWNADRTRQKAYHVIAACSWAVVAFIICVTVDNAKAKYAMLCFGGAGIWTAVPLFLSWTVTMFEGREKRAVCIALINGVGNLASIYGSFFWPSNTAPKYTMGFGITTGLMAASLAIQLFNKWKFNDKGWRHLKAQKARQ